MPAPLLETKFYVPRSRRGLVPRPRLGERLDRGGAAKLMLVSAPAGFGKTTLLAQWIAEWVAAPSTAATGQRQAVWLSLDRDDNDPATFWTYVIAALRTAAPGIGTTALALLTEPRPPPIQAVLATLLNDLGAVASDVVLVLDDYHVVDAREVQDGMGFLLDHLPPGLHLVIASRADPALPLARLRARGELVEVRAADLRFTPDEAAAYLNEVMGLHLSTRDVAALEGRTEGWIAALQLAALSMEGRADLTGFIAGFAGDDRYVVDYLVEEVVQRQSETVQAFLLQTSILGRLSGPLCDAVTGHEGGKVMLEALERGNLFLVALDDRRQWYRYHHLFADVLHARLLDEQPGQVPELHRRASAWYDQHGDQSAAIQHALTAGDSERAADLVELAMPATRRDRQEVTLVGWLELLPDEVVRARPVLNLGFVGALMSTGEVEGVEPRLRDVERWLAGTTSSDQADGADGADGATRTGMVVVDHDEFRRLPGWVAVYRAALALRQGEVSTTVIQAQRALDLLEEDDLLGHGAAAALRGLAFWTSGDLEAAHAAYAAATARLERAGHLSDVLGCSIALADLRIAQGRLHEAMHTYEQALRLSAPEGQVLRGTADMYVGMSALHYERNDLAAANRLLLQAQELGEHTGLPQNRYRWRVSMARVRAARGDHDGALALLDEAERAYEGDFSPNVRPVSALRARELIAQGRADDALGWAREHGLTVDDDLSYLHEFEHLTLARALLAQVEGEGADHSLDEAMELLERLLRAAEEGQRTGSVIELLSLQALALRVRGDLPAALVPLERALMLAEPEDYVRTFLDLGPAVVPLLRAAAKQGSATSHAGRLLAAMRGPEEGTPRQHGLVEPLSERELEVLRLLGSDLDGPQIARELTVSLNTMRTHTKNIYAKLGVGNRRAAVRRAAELDLLSRSRHPGT